MTHLKVLLRPACADTLRTLAARCAACDLKPGDKLYLAPADRGKIW